jgi:phosphoglycolate phosphatase-like HAD superfamily hydrolase
MAMHSFSSGRRRVVAGGAALAAAIALPACVATDPHRRDPLASWNEGRARQAILDFVARATRQGGADFVPPAERIAVFDNDGTLWSEQPMYFQLAFALDRVRALAPRHPEWRDHPALRAAISGDARALAATGEQGVLEVTMAAHAGISTEDFGRAVADWLASARHPRFQRPYPELVYQPMLELLDFLRARDFKTFIVSGGGVAFMRVFAERVYGIPPEQVVGSSGVMKFEMAAGGRPVLMKQAQVEFVDDGPGKPVGIERFIGRRPVLAFGNSDGDQQMLQWTAAGPGARFMGLVHHTDERREWAYDRASHIGRLDKALDEARQRAWTVVDMKEDWKVIYPFERTQR